MNDLNMKNKKDYELLKILNIEIDDLKIYSLEDVLKSPQIYRINGNNKKKLYAISELLNRLLKAEKKERLIIQRPKDIGKILIPKYRYETKEIFSIVLLNSKNAVISIEDIFIGSLNKSIAEPREVFREALKYPTASLILVHNHPSGDTTPSFEDISITKKFIKGGKLLGIDVLDHIIIGDNSFLSLKQQGLIEEES